MLESERVRALIQRKGLQKKLTIPSSLPLPQTEDAKLESEAYMEFLIELLTRLRKVYAAVFLLSLVIFFMPESFLHLKFTFENYNPAIYPMLGMIVDHSVKRMIEAGSGREVKIIITSPASVLSYAIQIALILATLASLPLIFYEFYMFVAPGLYFHERRLLKNAIGAFTFLFILGASIAYFFVLPITLGILTITTNPLLGQTEAPVLMFFSLESIFYIVFWGTVLTGALYTLPAVIYILVLLDVLDAEYLVQNRKFVILAILSLAAVITPDPTVVSMLIISVPLIAIYEITVQFALQHKRSKRRNYWKVSMI